jgi:crotonobetaine/carnitine-CoA ligase
MICSEEGLSAEAFAPNALTHWARVAPNTVAIQECGGGRRTYAELEREVRRWSAAIAGLGVGRGTHVAAMLPNGELAQLAMLALARLGAVEAPVNPALVGPLLVHQLKLCDAEVILTRAVELDRLLAVTADLSRLKTIVTLDLDEPGRDGVIEVMGRRAFFAVQSEPKVRPAVGRDVAAILFTSGTTGPSKGVITPWGVIAQTWSGAPPDLLQQGEVIYCPLPLHHNSGRSCLNFALAQGGTFAWRERFSGAQFWDDVRAEGCVAASLVGPMLQYLHAQPSTPRDADNPLRAIFSGPLIPDIEAFKQRFGVKAMTGYGMTEIGNVLLTDFDHGPWQACGRVRTSYPFPEVRLVDEHDEEVAPGEAGELIVRTDAPWTLTLGYYGMPDKTVEVWRNGWFHTGDLLRRDADGWYYLIDRLTDSIRRRGENISSAEVEGVVGRFPGVIECAAVAAPAEHGEDEVKVVLEVAEPSAFELDAFWSWCDENLPRYMRPRYVEPVTALPRNQTSQRVLKAVLRAKGGGGTTFDRVA